MTMRGSTHPFGLGGSNGQHRKTNSPLHGSPGTSPGSGSGGAAPSGSPPQSATAIATNQSAYTAALHHAMRQKMEDDDSIQKALMYQKMMMYQAMQQAAFYGTGSVTSRPHEPTTLKSEGLVVGEIIAWRAWNVRDEDLLSVVADGKIWSPTEPMQGDAAGGYGVHAYKGPHGPVLDEYVRRNSDKLWVIGEVAMWGDIIEHEDGYRSEFARVHSLVTWHDGVKPFHRKVLAEKYLKRPEYKIDDAA